jgi:hypothetical protein
VHLHFRLLLCCVLFAYPGANALREAAKVAPVIIAGDSRVIFDFIGVYIVVWPIRFILVSTKLLQYPLHLYMVLALRVSN